MHPLAPFSTFFRRRAVLIAAGLAVLLGTACSDFLAPSPPEETEDWVVEVGHKMTSPEILGPRAGVSSITASAPLGSYRGLYLRPR